MDYLTFVTVHCSQHNENPGNQIIFLLVRTNKKALSEKSKKKSSAPENYFKEFNAEGKLSKVELLLETN